ncbi:hypothetical protein NQ317_018873 [Molorchus minor]|uniref:Uncharacterized protein n=1 Tax=Molorchus minor TaxID=1323400 RepID=A0ABQ9JFR7_9CUCU|nr:hypothetical protein NQ317_018873 [Molorchus minor]
MREIEINTVRNIMGQVRRKLRIIEDDGNVVIITIYFSHPTYLEFFYQCIFEQLMHNAEVHRTADTISIPLPRPKADARRLVQRCLYKYLYHLFRNLDPTLHRMKTFNLKSILLLHIPTPWNYNLEMSLLGINSTPWN